MKTLSLHALSQIGREHIPFDGEWELAFGQPESTGAWMIYGKAGQGKTSFALQLARKFSDMGMRVLFLSLEMGFSEEYTNSLLDAGFNAGQNRDFVSADDVSSIEELEAYLSRQRSAHVVFIDSVQYFASQCGARSEDIIRLRRRFPQKVFVYISHVDGREVDGKTAYEVKRDCFKRIQVEGFKASFMGRGRGGERGYFVVWAEGYSRYWLETPQQIKEDETEDNDQQGDD